ncbi:MAG: hypothetical protein AAFR38_03345 [Planctomycetota bacterium]
MSRLPPSPWRIAGWALFLACSWTWCIGMFMPALMARDFGWPGFLVFAVPNVLGAAAMAWFYGSAEASRRFVEEHKPAVIGFSLVTILYQAFFLGWLCTGWNPADSLPWLVPLAVVAWTALAFVQRTPRVLVAAGVVWAISMGAGVYLANTGRLEWQSRAEPFFESGLIWMAPVSTLGFLLCPHLDPTFHRARRGMGRNESRAAFALGFGVFFAAMIALTYAAREHLLWGESATDLAPKLYAVHAVIQLCFTVRVHAAALRDLPTLRMPRRWVATAITLGLSLGIAMSFWSGLEDAGVSGREVAYRVLLSAYGLLFPGYLLIAKARGRADRITYWLAAAAVCVAGVFYWNGFLELDEPHNELWLVPGLVVVFAAAALAPSLGRQRTKLARV